MNSSLPPLIATYASQTGAGNTTVCRWLAQFDYEVIRVDDPKEKLLIAFLQQFGMPVDDAMTSMYLKPWVRLPELNISPAEMLLTLSDEWGRGCVHPDIWTMALCKRLKRSMKRGTRIVVDGIRYPYEYAMLNRMGMKFWRVHNPRALESMVQHPHTGLLDGHEFDEFIDNTGTEYDLQRRLTELTGEPSEALIEQSRRNQIERIRKTRVEEQKLGMTLTHELEPIK